LYKQLSDTSRVKLLILCIFLFIVSFILTSYTFKNRKASQSINKIIVTLIEPFVKITHNITSAVVGFSGRYIQLIEVKKENQTLKKKLAELQNVTTALIETRDENTRLKKILDVMETTKLRGVVANVIGKSPTPWLETLIIDVGENASIKPGMAVVGARGLVGQTISVGKQSALVLTISDPSSGVDALLQKSRAKGIIEGTSDGRCTLNFVSTEIHVEEGDLVITSGYDGIFPKGVLIGKIASLNAHDKGMFQKIAVEPAEDIRNLENVIVINIKPTDNEFGESPLTKSYFENEQ
jgi:rod shape-determining protein MreC